MTAWSEHVKRFAKKKGIKYQEAAKLEECKKSYRKKRMSPRKTSKKRMSPRKTTKKRMSPRKRGGRGKKMYNDNAMNELNTRGESTNYTTAEYLEAYEEAVRRGDYPENRDASVRDNVMGFRIWAGTNNIDIRKYL